MTVRFPTAPNLGTNWRELLCKTAAAPGKAIPWRKQAMPSKSRNAYKKECTDCG